MTQKKTLKLPKLIGHRGVKDLCPENTLESILKAFDLGLSFVEIDVKISKDRVPILLHDDTLDRTTNGSGLAIDYDYENIKKLDAGKFFYKENTNIFVPKLEDILSLCTNYNGNLNIELKPNKKFEKENVYQIYKIIKNINQIDIFFSSFDMISILEISKLYPQSIRSFLLDDFKEYNIDDLISISNNHDLEICGLNIDLVTADIIKKIKESNMAITVYSDKNINLSSANDIFSIGVDSIFVDNPLDLLGKF
ncbi:glycerophosphodiester phosphodiesterase family protein [Pelagibacteraceae bacterium]|nr:glycerophosphodiester phosphodiesterase family protein [Pelagibacteraceae bacterium]